MASLPCILQGRQGGGNATFLKMYVQKGYVWLKKKNSEDTNKQTKPCVKLTLPFFPNSCNLDFCCASFVSRSITRAYYRNSVGGLLLFDITNRRSFQNVHEWLEETKVHVQPYQIVFVLVGHKCDLDTQRQVTRHEAEKLAAAYGMKYIETSARDAINVEKAFTDLTRDIYELVKRGEISIQEGWEGVKSGFVPNVVHSSEEVVKSDRRCLCWALLVRQVVMNSTNQTYFTKWTQCDRRESNTPVVNSLPRCFGHQNRPRK